MGNTCIPVLNSFQYMAKPIQYCKVKNKIKFKAMLKKIIIKTISDKKKKKTSEWNKSAEVGKIILLKLKYSKLAFL